MTSKFEKCANNEELCTCGIYVRVNNTSPAYAFIDKCSRDPLHNNKFKYYDESLQMMTSNDHPLISCDSSVDSINKIDWSNLETNRKFFKCVRLKSEPNKPNTYLVRFINPILSPLIFQGFNS